MTMPRSRTSAKSNPTTQGMLPFGLSGVPADLTGAAQSGTAITTAVATTQGPEATEGPSTPTSRILIPLLEQSGQDAALIPSVRFTPNSLAGFSAVLKRLDAKRTQHADGDVAGKPDRHGSGDRPDPANHDGAVHQLLARLALRSLRAQRLARNPQQQEGTPK